MKGTISSAKDSHCDILPPHRSKLIQINWTPAETTKSGSQMKPFSLVCWLPQACCYSNTKLISKMSSIQSLPLSSLSFMYSASIQLQPCLAVSPWTWWCPQLPLFCFLAFVTSRIVKHWDRERTHEKTEEIITTEYKWEGRVPTENTSPMVRF